MIKNNQSLLTEQKQEFVLDQKIGTFVVDKISFKNYQECFPEFSYNIVEHKQQILKSATKPEIKSSFTCKEFVATHEQIKNKLLKNYSITEHGKSEHIFSFDNFLIPEDIQLSCQQTPCCLPSRMEIISQQTKLRKRIISDKVQLKSNCLRTLSPLQKTMMQKSRIRKQGPLQ